MLPESTAREAASRFLAPDTIGAILGAGIDGIVYSTSRATAVKVHQNSQKYQKELHAYQRLASHRVRAVASLAVPALIAFSSSDLVIEISIVRPPYLLDFASCDLDQPADDFTEEVWEQWRRDRREEFGANWPAALAVARELERRYGIYYRDLSPRNLDFTGGS